MDAANQFLGTVQGGWRIIEVVLIFGFLVLAHEFGHFVTARMFGMRVDEFAIGFGKRLFWRKRGETIYSINMLPLGGFCKIYGMEIEDEAQSGEGEEAPKGKGEPPASQPVADTSIAPKDDPRAFVNRPLFHRFVVITAGSVANLVIAVLLVFFIGITLGFPAAELGGVIPGGPAAVAGLLPGDIITHLDGTRLSSTSDLHAAVAFSEGKPLGLKGLRGVEQFDLTVIPRQIRLAESNFCRLGFVYLNDGTIIYAMPDTPAARAGLQPGDIILSIDGLVFPSHNLDISSGDGVTSLVVYRGYFNQTVKMDHFNNEFVQDTYSPFGFFTDSEQFVTAVIPNDIAHEAGLRVGDRIVSSSRETWVHTGSKAGTDIKPLDITFERNSASHRIRLKPDEPFSRIQVYMDDASRPVLVNLPYDHRLALAGLKNGDRILSVGGSPTPNGISVFLELERKLGQNTSIVILRGGQELIFNAMLPSESSGQEIGTFLNGLHFKVRYFRVDPLSSLGAGIRKCVDIVIMVFKTIQWLITGRASMDDLLGPVGIATATYQAASNGLVDLINIIILLSVNLGIFNLLPFPALDGGRMVFMIAEGIFRKPVVGVRMENLIHLAGFVLLLLFLVLVTYHDLARVLFPN
jgi:regulator of sigma E protease